MKRLLITLTIVAGLGMSANAQFNTNTQTDGFFTSAAPSDGWRADYGTEDLPLLPGAGFQTDQSAPVGSGLLLLAGMGMAYALRRRNNN